MTGSLIMVPLLALFDDPNVTFLFNDWTPVVRVVFIAVAGYITLLVLLRASGQRTLSQLTSFDLVITVTVGSAFGRVITARDVALVEVVAAFGSLVLLQVLVAWIWGHLPRVRAVVTPTPGILYHEGTVIHREMRRFHLREADLRSAVRQQGRGSLADVRTIIMEGNGAMSVISEDGYGDGQAITEAGELPPSN